MTWKCFSNARESVIEQINFHRCINNKLWLLWRVESHRYITIFTCCIQNLHTNQKRWCLKGSSAIHLQVPEKPAKQKRWAFKQVTEGQGPKTVKWYIWNRSTVHLTQSLKQLDFAPCMQFKECMHHVRMTDVQSDLSDHMMSYWKHHF